MPGSNQKSDPRALLLKYAVNILSRRPYFRHTLKHKLLLRAENFCHSRPDRESIQILPIIDNILDDLAQSGYLDDQYLAEAYVRRQLSKCYGPKIISLKLKQLGLSPEIIKEVLSSEATRELQEDAIKKYVAKYSRLDPRKISYKLYQRGFSPDIVNHACPA